MRRALFWAAAAVLGLAELAVLGLVLVPRADPTYRAYFIDRSSDCWPHETDAHYKLGETISFVFGKQPEFTPNKICGWFYPGPEGTWSYGSYSLLRFRFTPASGPLTLMLEAEPMAGTQRVAVSANGKSLGTMEFTGTIPEQQRLAIPAELAATGDIELRFDYPDARSGKALGPNEDSHLRAIRAVSLALLPAA